MYYAAFDAHFKMRACPICDGMASRRTFPYATQWNNKVFSYLACENCDTTYVDPLPLEEDFARMYSKNLYHDVHYSGISIEPYRASIDRVVPYLRGKKTLVDFGCGNGEFIMAAQESGFQCCGVEYDPAVRRSTAQRTGAPIYDVAELKAIGRTFDVVHLGDVLEHLAHPVDAIAELAPLLANGGVFYVEGPLEANPSLVYWSAQWASRARQILGRGTSASHPPAHLFMTNRRAQMAFFTERLGYRCVFFEFFETGWPYLNRDPLAARMSLGSYVKRAIGQSSVLAASVLPYLGNRFIGIFSPTSSSQATDAP